MYDPAIGMFLTADIIVPDWTNPQTLNRYSYCYNNPLNYTDPDGHFGILIGMAIGAIASGIQSDWDPEAMIVGAAIGGLSAGITSELSVGISHWGLAGAMGPPEAGMMMAGNVIGGAVNAGLSAAYYGGDVGKAMLNGGFNGGMFGGIDSFYGNRWSGARVGMEALAGGVSEEFRGGKFMDGFVQMGGFALANHLYMRLGQTNFEAEADINFNGPRPQGTHASPAFQCVGLHQTLGQLQNSLGTVGGFIAFHTAAEGGVFMRGLSLVPGFNRFAAQHDEFITFAHPGLITNAPRGTGWFMQTAGTWSISAPLTYAAIGRDVRNYSFR